MQPKRAGSGGLTDHPSRDLNRHAKPSLQNPLGFARRRRERTKAAGMPGKDAKSLCGGFQRGQAPFGAAQQPFVFDFWFCESDSKFLKAGAIPGRRKASSGKRSQVPGTAE